MTKNPKRKIQKPKKTDKGSGISVSAVLFSVLSFIGLISAAKRLKKYLGKVKK